MRWLAVSAALLGGLAVGCGGTDTAPIPDGPRPRLLAKPEHLELARGRLDRDPYDAILAVIEARAAAELEEPASDVWDYRAVGHNNEIAQESALLAWLKEDPQAAARAREILLAMPTNFDTFTWDVNIRMPHVLMPACFAWDLLRATPWLGDADAAAIRGRITDVTAPFFEAFLENGITRQLVLGFSQNNHPIRTAAAIGLVAITFPDHPDAPKWANWALGELDYLLGPSGQYIQPDGGVSEGPFYYNFAYGPAIAMAIAMKNSGMDQRTWQRDCRNRQDVPPWEGHGCVEGEPFAYQNPLDGELLRKTLDWSINLRIPGEGWRAPLGDANFIAHNGGALLTSFGGGGHLYWDWDHNGDDRPMTWGLDLTAHHLIYVDDAVEPVEPPWRNGFLPEAGNAVLRSGWEEDARWLLLVGEKGAARKTLHDHVDGTSFTLAAYGEYLLVDPGYYKPVETDNAVTADSDSHNTLRIDGEGAPDKGLLHDFGDADASIENTVDGDKLAYAEAHQSYRESDIERSVVFVRRRYFVVADRVATMLDKPREHAWRLGGWAGKDVGGVFELRGCLAEDGCGARWERTLAGVDVHLAATEPGLKVIEPPYTPLAAPHVEAFDRQRNVQDHAVIDGVVTGVAPGFLAILAPYRVGGSGDDAPLEVTALDAGQDAAAWLVEGSGGREVVWLRRAGATSTLAVDTHTVESDAELVVVDLGGAFGLIARGGHAKLDGVALVSGSGQVTLVE